MQKTQDQKKVQKRELVGIVISTAMKNTIVVKVERLSRHPVYKKTVKRTKNFSAHNVREDIKLGDRVRIAETRPISKTKHFHVVEKM